MSVVEDSNKQMLFDLLKSIGNDNQLVINENDIYNFVNEKCGYFHANRYEFGFGTDLKSIKKKKQTTKTTPGIFTYKKRDF